MVKNPEEKRRAAETLTEQASSLFYVGRYAEALGLFEEIISLDDTVIRGHTGRAASLAQLGRPEEGLASAEYAIKLDPSFAPVYTTLGLCLHRLGRDGEAHASFKRALDIDPDHPRVLYNCACYWAELGNEGRCRDFLSRAFHDVDYEAIEHSMNDPDLARYAHTDWFREILAEAKRRRHEPRPPV